MADFRLIAVSSQPSDWPLECQALTATDGSWWSDSEINTSSPTSCSFPLRGSACNLMFLGLFRSVRRVRNLATSFVDRGRAWLLASAVLSGEISQSLCCQCDGVRPNHNAGLAGSSKEAFVELHKILCFAVVLASVQNAMFQIETERRCASSTLARLLIALDRGVTLRTCIPGAMTMTDE
jgi:hypothetical protein